MDVLSKTAYVILGLLALQPMAGYDIKTFADHSTRHFWAVSFGQIYPELKRLEEAGLVRSQDSAVGSRQRTVYRLTEAGREALQAWLADTSASTQEIRDEMLLRLFFADAMPPAQTRRLLESMVTRHRLMAAQLVGHRPVASQHGRNLKLSVLEFGVDYHTFCADWFGNLKAQIPGDEPARESLS